MKAVELVLLMLLLSSPSSLNWNDSNGGVAQARKLIAAQVTPHHSSPRHNVTIDVDDVGMIPARQVGIDLRRIPPSTSNPTQNKSRPRFTAPGNSR
ncbi:hypothetical protein OPV22_011369 [Ensete ventricosum]|uniref:Secreted protein n=1 Tax=Ensete ventricosum TaxID=4639 RepID=A0AAV8RIX2_ENSVE|nr:hypothetical protein OPV22_011369 [Ensete ventricosum]RWW08986.1 hypothetical protein GW17_00027550 [Ensete ventricosum]RWW36780.1 hypothetical protein BHE74_00058171 [Ensete ventricosum]RZS04316.1 hypothetical protein BHM03_00034638 [Ensete ventricosum]